MVDAKLLHRAEKACAKWKRKNYRVEQASINGLVRMLQEDYMSSPDPKEISYEAALKILMICFKDDSLAFAERVSAYFEGKTEWIIL